MTSFRFNDSLEGLTGLKKAVISIVTVHYIEKIQIKFAKEKRHMGQSPKETRHKLPAICPLPVESYRQLFLLPAMTDNTTKHSNHGSSPKPWCPESVLGVRH